MKKLFATVALVFAMVAVSNAQGVLKFSKEVHDFGKVNEGDPATIQFEVKNTGNAPVVIANAQPSCGCTTPEWSKEPIMPGATSKIKVGYNTPGRVGSFNKTVTVTSNAENSTVVLTIKGEVLQKVAAAAPAQKAVAAPVKTTKKG
jgi:uncharacterized protein (DUF58 family)